MFFFPSESRISKVSAGFFSPVCRENQTFMEPLLAVDLLYCAVQTVL